ncbi:MAG: hypothetical protein JNL19_12330 [Burkholderiales bacterium]|nr:hypothetical protein [Burkholderiales bacterium]
MDRNTRGAVAFTLAVAISVPGHAFKLKVESAGKEQRVANLRSVWSLSSLFGSSATFVLDNFWHDLNHEELTHRIFGCESDAEQRACAPSTNVGQFAPLPVLVGVRWNDNPPFQLEDDQRPKGCRGTTVKLPVLQPDCWLTVFSQGKKDAAAKADGSPGRFFDGASRSALLLRSHFGDMQFLHAMARRDGERAADTKQAILDWAEFTYRTATKDFAGGQYLYQLPIRESAGIGVSDKPFAQLFDRQKGWTVTTLFTLGDDTFRAQPAFSWIAFGSLLHVIQDSFARGHVERSDTPGQTCQMSYGAKFDKPGRVRAFRSYSNQDDGLHGREDGVAALEAHLLSPPPGAVEVGKVLLAMYRSNAPWAQVQEYLRDCVFDLEDPDALSGPGEEFRTR